MTQYLIIHQRSLYNHPAGLLPRARILLSREGNYELQILMKTRKRYCLFRKCALQSYCDLAYAVVNYAITRRMDPVPNVQNHVTF